MNKIKYVIGDATNPIDNGKPIVIPHVANNVGKWGAGFVKALSKKWPEPEERYRREFNKPNRTGHIYLGNTHFVKIPPDNNIIVANMIAQYSTISKNNPKPIRYTALTKCMIDVESYTCAIEGKIHAPRFGSALAGGKWSFIEELIYEIWIDNGISVTIYDLPQRI